MEMNSRKIIDSNIKDLVETIDVKNTTLWEELTRLGLFTSSDVQHIKVSVITFFLDFCNPKCGKTVQKQLLS